MGNGRHKRTHPPFSIRFTEAREKHRTSSLDVFLFTRISVHCVRANHLGRATELHTSCIYVHVLMGIAKIGGHRYYHYAL